MNLQRERNLLQAKLGESGLAWSALLSGHGSRPLVFCHHAAVTSLTQADLYNVMGRLLVCKPVCCCIIIGRYQFDVPRAKFWYGLISSCLTLRTPQWYATGFAGYLDLCCSFSFVLVCEHMFYSVSDNVCRRSASSCKPQLQHVEWLFQQSGPIWHRQECANAISCM